MIALNSRGPLIAFLVGAICLFPLYSTREKMRIVSLTPIVLMVVILSFILLPSQYTGRYLLMASLEGSPIAIRLDMWQFVAEHLSDWFFTGVGLSGFAYYCARTVDPLVRAVYPHNIFLDVFADAGFCGFLVFVWLLCYQFYKCIIMSHVGEYSIHLLGLAVTVAAIYFVIAYLFSGTLTDTRGLWFFGGLILSLEQLWRRDKKCSGHVKG